MSNAKQNLRRKHFTDRAVQGALLLHVVGNWLMFLLVVAIFLLFIEMFANGPREAVHAMLRRYAPFAWAVVVLAPMFLWDMVKLSHRFAGPMVRLRREMRNLAEGRAVAPIRFRDGDFWQDLAVDFNRVAERVQTLEAALRERSTADSHDRPDDASEPTDAELARS
jgi:hypothetical protein